MITSVNALYVVLPLYAYSIGASQIEIGLIGAVYWAVQIPLQPLMGKLSNKISNKVMLLIGICGNGLLIMFLPLSHYVWQLIVIRLVQGAFISAFWPSTRTFAADEAPPMKVGEVMGLYGVAMSLGSMVGPFFGGYISDNFGFYYGFVMAFLMPIMALFPILVTLRSRDQMKKLEAKEQFKNDERTGKTDSGYENRILIIALMALFVEGLTWGITGSVFPVYLNIHDRCVCGNSEVPFRPGRAAINTFEEAIIRATTVATPNIDYLRIYLIQGESVPYPLLIARPQRYKRLW